MGVSRGPSIGVDVQERVRLSDLDALVRRFFHPDEATELSALAQADREAAFFRMWVIKEAVTKTLGLGLGLPLNGFCVSLTSKTPELIIAPGDSIHSDWTIIEFLVGSNYRAALTTSDRVAYLDACELNRNQIDALMV